MKRVSCETISFFFYRCIISKIYDNYNTKNEWEYVKEGKVHPVFENVLRTIKGEI